MEIRRRRFTIDEVAHMLNTGILRQEEGVELLEGDVVRNSPIGKRHSWCVDRLTRIFVTRVPAGTQVRVRGPIRLDAMSLPLPDLAVLRGRKDGYSGGWPGPADIHLILEVGDGANDAELAARTKAYATAGIQELWHVDLGSERVVVHRGPEETAYRAVQSIGRGGVLEPRFAPDLKLTADELLR